MPITEDSTISAAATQVPAAAAEPKPVQYKITAFAVDPTLTFAKNLVQETQEYGWELKQSFVEFVTQEICQEKTDLAIFTLGTDKDDFFNDTSNILIADTCSCFYGLPRIAQTVKKTLEEKDNKTRVAYETYTQADTIGNQPHGTNFAIAQKHLGKDGNYRRTKIPSEVTEGLQEKTKVPLLYAHMWKLASEAHLHLPSSQIEPQLQDNKVELAFKFCDKENILQNLDNFYKQNQNFIPKGMKLQLYIYDGTQSPKFYREIIGTGDPDLNYDATVKMMFSDCERFGDGYRVGTYFPIPTIANTEKFTNFKNKRTAHLNQKSRIAVFSTQSVSDVSNTTQISLSTQLPVTATAKLSESAVIKRQPKPLDKARLDVAHDEMLILMNLAIRAIESLVLSETETNSEIQRSILNALGNHGPIRGNYAENSLKWTMQKLSELPAPKKNLRDYQAQLVQYKSNFSNQLNFILSNKNVLSENLIKIVDIFSEKFNRIENRYLKNNSFFYKNSDLKKAARHGHNKTVKKMIANGAEPIDLPRKAFNKTLFDNLLEYEDAFALITAIKNGHLEATKTLFTETEKQLVAVSHADNFVQVYSHALAQAARNHKKDIVEYLLQRVDEPAYKIHYLLKTLNMALNTSSNSTCIDFLVTSVTEKYLEYHRTVGPASLTFVDWANDKVQPNVSPALIRVVKTRLYNNALKDDLNKQKLEDQSLSWTKFAELYKKYAAYGLLNKSDTKADDKTTLLIAKLQSGIVSAIEKLQDKDQKYALMATLLSSTQSTDTDQQQARLLMQHRLPLFGNTSPWVTRLKNNMAKEIFNRIDKAQNWEVIDELYVDCKNIGLINSLNTSYSFWKSDYKNNTAEKLMLLAKLNKKANELVPKLQHQNQNQHDQQLTLSFIELIGRKQELTKLEHAVYSTVNVLKAK